MYLLHNKLANPKDRIKVDIVGCGATGSSLLVRLAKLSNTLQEFDRKPFKIAVYDPDVVEPHNICNQRFYPPDIGGSKAKILASRINRAMGCDIDAYQRIYDGFESEIIITCVDNFDTRRYIHQKLQGPIKKSNSYRFIKTYYWIDVGNGKDFGQVVIASYDEEKEKNLPSIVELNPEPILEKEMVSCSARESLSKQAYGINEFAATLTERMLADLFLNMNLEYSEIYFDYDKMIINKNSI